MKDVLAKPIKSFLDGKMQTANSPAYLMSKSKFDKFKAKGLVKEVSIDLPPALTAGELSSALPADPVSQAETASLSDGGETNHEAPAITESQSQVPEQSADSVSQAETAQRRTRRSSSPIPPSE